MSFGVGHRQAVFKLYPLRAGIDELQKEMPILFPGSDFNVCRAILRFHPAAGPERIFQCIGEQHAEVCLGHRDKLRDMSLNVERHTAALRPACKGREDEVRSLVLAVGRHLAGLYLGADALDVLLRLLSPAVLDAGGDVLQMVAQVVAVGAGLLLGGAQGLDLPHRLADLQFEVVPGLFQLAAGALLCRDPEDKDDIRHAAHEGHEFHRRLIALGEKVGVDTGHIIEKVACQRHYAEQKLHRARIPGKAAGRRGNIAQQYRQQRQRDHNLDGGLQPVDARHHRNDQQCHPAPELTAQICRQHRDGGPEPFSAEDAEDDGKRQMSDKRIRLLHRRPAILISNKRLHQEHGC